MARGQITNDHSTHGSNAVDTLDYGTEVTGMGQEPSSGDPGAGRRTPQPQTLCPTSTGHGVSCCPARGRQTARQGAVSRERRRKRCVRRAQDMACRAAPQGEDKQHARARRRGSGAAKVVADENWTWRVVLSVREDKQHVGARRRASGVAALCPASTGHGELCCPQGKTNSTSRRGDAGAAP